MRVSKHLGGRKEKNRNDRYDTRSDRVSAVKRVKYQVRFCNLIALPTLKGRLRTRRNSGALLYEADAKEHRDAAQNNKDGLFKH